MLRCASGSLLGSLGASQGFLVAVLAHFWLVWVFFAMFLVTFWLCLLFLFTLGCCGMFLLSVACWAWFFCILLLRGASEASEQSERAKLSGACSGFPLLTHAFAGVPLLSLYVACSSMVCLLSLHSLALPCVTCFNSPKTISLLLLHASTTLTCLRASRSLLRQVFFLGPVGSFFRLFFDVFLEHRF